MTTAPESLPIASLPEETDTARQLVAAALAIREWQASRPTRIVDEALVKRFPALGSTKTYKRLLTGDTVELRCDAMRAHGIDPLPDVLAELTTSRTRLTA